MPIPVPGVTPGRPCPAALFVVALLALSIPAQAWASGPANRELGVGLMLGEPSGLTGKYWFDPTHALDVHLAFDFSEEAGAVMADYLFHLNVFNLKSSAVDLPVYVGVGGKLLVRGDEGDKDRDNVLLGVRAPLGLSVLLREAPLEFFGELALGLRLFPGTGGDLDGGVGLRYYF